MADSTSFITTTMKPSTPRGVDAVVPVVPVVLAVLAVPAVPVVHQKDSEALMAPGPEASGHPPKALNEGQVENLEIVPAWIAPDEAKVRADLIKAKPTMALPSVEEEVVEVVVEGAVEVVVEGAIRPPRHLSHC